MEDISTFMESLHSNFLIILQTDELLKSTVSRLGASKWVRFLTYGKYASLGLSPKLIEEIPSFCEVFLENREVMEQADKFFTTLDVNKDKVTSLRQEYSELKEQVTHLKSEGSLSWAKQVWRNNKDTKKQASQRHAQ